MWHSVIIRQDMDVTDIVGDLHISREQDDTNKIYKHDDAVLESLTLPFQ